jgi:hypothetical protein
MAASLEMLRSVAVEASETLVELARSDDPPPDLKPFLSRLGNAGVTRLWVVTWPSPWRFEVVGGTAAIGHPLAVAGSGYDVMIWTAVDWERSSAPITTALNELAEQLQRFDRVRRLKHAASDMRLVADTAAALIDAREADGPARMFDRVLETGMVVTYARPFLESNNAGVGRRDRPHDADDRALHDELVDLRDRYYAHADHGPERTLRNATAMLGQSGRPRFVEQWEQLAPAKLRAIADLATRQAEGFEAEADGLDERLWGPRE